MKNPPTPEEIEHRRELQKLQVIPEGLSKNEWKKQQKLKRREEAKVKYKHVYKEKKKLQRQRKRERVKDDEEYRNSLKRPKDKIATDVNIIIDCQFDDYMNDKEIVSMSSQIRLCYSAMIHCKYKLPITITSFNKRLEERHNTRLVDYKNWQGIEFTSQSIEEVMVDKDKCIYLTPDTEEDIEELLPDHTYVIGGIIDKNRHPNLCLNKAKEMGLKVGRLPIGRYIKINGRNVLVTSHVYELCCKWFEYKDWEKAFNKVLPPRKINNQ